jgi:hypothetical protein
MTHLISLQKLIFKAGMYLDHLPSMHTALDSILSTTKKKKMLLNIQEILSFRNSVPGTRDKKPSIYFFII